MRQFYVAYEDREDEIIQSGIGRFGQTFEIIQSGSDLKSAVIKKIQKFLLELGQMQMYVNYFDRYERVEDENPTVGILLCKQSDEALVNLNRWDMNLSEIPTGWGKDNKDYSI